MKTQSQTIADLIAFNDKEHLFEPEFNATHEILLSIAMLALFVAFMWLIMFLGSAVY